MKLSEFKTKTKSSEIVKTVFDISLLINQCYLNIKKLKITNLTIEIREFYTTYLKFLILEKIFLRNLKKYVFCKVQIFCDLDNLKQSLNLFVPLIKIENKQNLIMKKISLENLKPREYKNTKIKLNEMLFLDNCILKLSKNKKHIFFSLYFINHNFRGYFFSKLNFIEIFLKHSQIKNLKKTIKCISKVSNPGLEHSFELQDVSLLKKLHFAERKISLEVKNLSWIIANDNNNSIANKTVETLTVEISNEKLMILISRVSNIFNRNEITIKALVIFYLKEKKELKNREKLFYCLDKIFTKRLISIFLELLSNPVIFSLKLKCKLLPIAMTTNNKIKNSLTSRLRLWNQMRNDNRWHTKALKCFIQKASLHPQIALWKLKLFKRKDANTEEIKLAVDKLIAFIGDIETNNFVYFFMQLKDYKPSNERRQIEDKRNYTKEQLLHLAKILKICSIGFKKSKLICLNKIIRMRMINEFKDITNENKVKDQTQITTKLIKSNNQLKKELDSQKIKNMNLEKEINLRTKQMELMINNMREYWLIRISKLFLKRKQFVYQKIFNY